MAIRYVKDFEFPSAAGFTDSATPVTGQMYAKGGQAKAPKGKEMVLLIGVGMPKKPPMKKAEGGAISDAERRMLDEMAAEADATTSAERTMKRGEGSMTDAERRAMQRMAKKPAPAKKGSPYVPGTNIPASINYDEEQAARAQRGYKMGGKIQYEDGGKDTSVPVKDVKSGKVKQSRDADYYREMEQMKKPAFKKGGAMKHEDEAMDRKLVKQMIKPAALKKAGGGMAQEVQMAKSNAISKSLKGQKQTPMAKGGMKSKYADGGTVMAPQGSLAVNPALMNVSDNRRQHMLARDLRKNPVNDMLTTPVTGGPTPPPGSLRETGGPLPRPGDFSDAGGRGGAPGGGASNFNQRPGNNQFGPNIGGPGRGRPGVVPAGAGPYRPGVTPFPPTSAGYKSGGKVKSPLQSMGISPRGMSLKQAKGVPAASRAPMIAPPAMGMNMGQTRAPLGSEGVGVGEGRPGKPNVGAIRAAMAKAATAANPDASPAMMKRGGKTSMSKC